MKKTYFERYFKKEQRILMDFQLRGLAMDSPLNSKNIVKIDDKKYEKHLCYALNCIHNGDSSDIFDGIKQKLPTIACDSSVLPDAPLLLPSFFSHPDKPETDRRKSD